MRFAQDAQHDTSQVLRLPRKMTMEVSKVPSLPGKMRLIFWKRRACHTKRECHESATPPTQNHITTCFDTVKQIRCCNFPHRHGEARGKPETQDETCWSIKTNISCETSSNFHTLWHLQPLLLVKGIEVNIIGVALYVDMSRRPNGVIDPFNRCWRQQPIPIYMPQLRPPLCPLQHILAIALLQSNWLAIEQRSMPTIEPPLIIAARNRDKEMVQILLDAQADTGVRTRTRDSEAVVQGLWHPQWEGATALQIARWGHSPELVQLLLSAQ